MGTPRRDVLMGTKHRDVICGLGGNDTLRGLGGNDVLIGGAGSDRLVGGRGLDVLIGERGADLMLGRKGADRMLGGAGADRMDGGSGPDRLAGGPGDDYLNGGPGTDLLMGDRGNDYIVGLTPPDRLRGGAGTDLLPYEGRSDLHLGRLRPGLLGALAIAGALVAASTSFGSAAPIGTGCTPVVRTLDNGDPAITDGAVRVRVDGLGAFGRGLVAGADAIFNPPGGFAPLGTTYTSNLYESAAGRMPRTTASAGKSRCSPRIRSPRGFSSERFRSTSVRSSSP